jgi:3alpha(or 20beta)-hydroxysteroid dehydrogenase
MGRLEGKVALITGGARGQGEAHARRFVAEGAKVVIADVLDALGRRLSEDLGADAVYVRLDVTDEQSWTDAVAATVERYGRLDVLVNNAGILRVGPLVDTSLEDYRAVIDVNQVGCFLGMRSVIEPMTRGGGGSIVNVSSIAGLQGVPGVIGYVASKYAIRGMTKAAALELGHQGIRVNSVHPGTIDTPMVGGEEFADVDQEAVYASLPIPRIGAPEDVSHLMVFLASDESSYCTGGEYVVDGGVMAGPPMPGIVDTD